MGEQTGVIRVSQLPPRTQPGDGFTRIINPAPTVRGAAPVPAPTVRPSRQPRWMFLLGRFWARVRGDR